MHHARTLLHAFPLLILPAATLLGACGHNDTPAPPPDPSQVDQVNGSSQADEQTTAPPEPPPAATSQAQDGVSAADEAGAEPQSQAETVLLQLPNAGDPVPLSAKHVPVSQLARPDAELTTTAGPGDVLTAAGRSFEADSVAVVGTTIRFIGWIDAQLVPPEVVAQLPSRFDFGIWRVDMTEAPVHPQRVAGGPDRGWLPTGTQLPCHDAPLAGDGGAFVLTTHLCDWRAGPDAYLADFASIDLTRTWTLLQPDGTALSTVDLTGAWLGGHAQDAIRDSLVWSPDGDRLLVHEWLHPDQPLAVLIPGEPGRVIGHGRSPSWANDANSVFFIADDQLRHVDLDGNLLPLPEAVAVTEVAASPTASRVAIYSFGAVSLVDVSTGARTYIGSSSGAPVWSPDGRYLAHLTDTRRIAIYDTATDTTHETSAAFVRVPRVAWSPVSDRFAAVRAVQDDQAWPFEAVIVTTDAQIEAVLGRVYNVTWFDWAPDGSALAVTVSLDPN